MFQVVVDATTPVFGPSYLDRVGGIGLPGNSRFKHRFGGDSWLVDDTTPLEVKPCLILTLDISDPILASLSDTSLNELPLCSYVSCDLCSSPQFYRVDQQLRRVTCLQRSSVPGNAQCGSSTPRLKEKSLIIQTMTDEDFPTSESAYWRASDLFLGGGRFIRVLGPPLWLDAVEIVQCNCGRTMKYVCSLGYETRPPYSQLIENQPVMFGEMGIYWFTCAQCLTIAVITQST